MERYARQTVFSHIGIEGQETLLKSKVTIIGMGALGTVAANSLCRAGVGKIRMADRDYVELTNLQRQCLYNEEDVSLGLPKAIAAYNHLSRINSQVFLDPVVTDVNPSNIEEIIGDADLVLDAGDNFEIRFLINDACDKKKVPWIYCGALGSAGTTMNILQKDNEPCLRCHIDDSEASFDQSCSAFGVLNMITATMASIQAAEAIKILLNSDSVRKGLLAIDLWSNSYNTLALSKNYDCPVCVHKRYEHLGKTIGSYTTDICGSNSIQVVPAQPKQIDLDALAVRLGKTGAVQLSPFYLRFADDKYEITLFKDGRAIIKNAIDSNNAKTIYTEYLG